MSLPDNSREAADALVARLVDDPESVSTDSAEELKPDPARVADLQLLHALLHQVHRPDRDDARIERVLRALETPPGVTDPSRDPKGARVLTWPRVLAWTGGGLAAAAAALLLVSLVVSPREKAQAATARGLFQEALTRSQATEDRHYQIHLEHAGSMPDRLLTLTLRDPRHFVLTSAKPRLVLGANDSEVWLVPPFGPILVRESLQFEAAWLNLGDEHLPYLNLATALERLGEGYEFQFAEEFPTPSPTQGLLVTAVRNDAKTPGPSRAELLVDPESHEVTWMRLMWNEAVGAAPSVIEMELFDRTPVSDDLFRHETHHGPNRAVLRR